MNGEHIEYVTTHDGARLWTATTGVGGPFVLNHGGSGMWDYLEPVAATVDDIARVHRWDQRGAGRSSLTPPYSAAIFVRDLEAVREHFGYERWIVGGHSWGAALALAYALEYPERTRAVVYISGTGIGSGWRAEYYAGRRRRLEEVGAFGRWEELLHRERTPGEDREYCALTWMTDYVDLEAGRQAAEAMLADGFLPNFEVNRTVRPSEDEEAMIARCITLGIPALIVHGAFDTRPVTAIASLAEALPRSRVAVIPNAGHLPWFEQPATFAEALRGFLRGLEG
jgi:proline iminopeptidase